MKTFLLILSLLGGALGAGSRGFTSGSGSHPVRATVHVVQPGETLWAIAGPIGGDRREVVYEITELNHLRSSGLVPGQHLQLPSR